MPRDGSEAPVITLMPLVVGIVLAFAFLTLDTKTTGRRASHLRNRARSYRTHLFRLRVGRPRGRTVPRAWRPLGVLLYGAAAWVGFRRSAALLALGWAMHVVWDVALHLQGAGAEYTPGWYPWGCLSFDLVVAGAVLTACVPPRARRRRPGPRWQSLP